MNWHRPLSAIWATAKGRIASLMNFDPYTKRTAREKKFAEGRLHVAPSAGRVFTIAVATLLLSWLFYAFLLQDLQHNLKVAYEKTPLLRVILEDDLGRAFAPVETPGRRVTELLGTELRPARDPSIAVFYDDQAVTPQAIFMTLKALEVIEADTSYEELYPKASQTRPGLRPARELIEKVKAAAGTEELRKVGALSLIAGIATKIGSEGSHKTGLARECYVAALGQVLAGYPGRWETLMSAARNSLVNEGGDCPLATQQPWLADYMLTFRVTRPAEVAVARVLLTLSGGIKVGSLASDASANRCEGEFRSEDVNDIEGRSACLGEILIRRLISRATASPDVKQVQFWIDILIGWPQALLNWTTLFLLVLLFERWCMFTRLRREMRCIPIWLDLHKRELSESKKVILEQTAKTLADTLNDWLRDGHTFAKANEGMDGKVRKDSLAIFMASKALNRLLVGDNQPELFREFCVTRRALVDESAWLLRYLARSLPALGFIGTILGILFALESADGILRAQDIEGRVVAMASVTGQLAFAFSHTFLALVASLITGFLIDRQTAQERILLFEYEEALVDRIDRAERAADQATVGLHHG